MPGNYCFIGSLPFQHRHHRLCHSVRFTLVLITCLAKDTLELHPASLLDHVGQLMSQKPSAMDVTWVIFAVAEENILACRESSCVERLVELICFNISVNPYMTEVRAKSRFHVRAHGLIQSLPPAVRPLDRVLHFRHNLCFTIRSLSLNEHHLHELVPVRALELEQGSCEGWRSSLTHRYNLRGRLWPLADAFFLVCSFADAEFHRDVPLALQRSPDFASPLRLCNGADQV